MRFQPLFFPVMVMSTSTEIGLPSPVPQCMVCRLADLRREFSIKVPIASLVHTAPTTVMKSVGQDQQLHDLHAYCGGYITISNSVLILVLTLVLMLVHLLVFRLVLVLEPIVA